MGESSPAGASMQRLGGVAVSSNAQIPGKKKQTKKTRYTKKKIGKQGSLKEQNKKIKIQKPILKKCRSMNHLTKNLK